MKDKMINPEHSKETDAILGTKIPWIIRWGATILFVFFVGLIVACCFVSNPLPGYPNSNLFEYIISPLKSIFYQ